MSVYLQVTNHIADLKELVFPYTPQIDYSTDVKYDTYSTVHTNYLLYGYTRSEPPQIQLVCKFSAHTTEHFQLSHYAIRFLRTYTKMNYGRKDPMRGQTPRIMRFYAYGEQMFYNIPVVINKFNMTFPDDIDYMRGYFNKEGKLIANPVRNVSVPSTSVHENYAADQQVVISSTSLDPPAIYLPAYFQITISLLMQQNLYETVQTFNLEDFAAGDLSSEGYI